MMQRAFLFLFTVLAMTKLVTGKDEEPLPKPHVIIVGPTGAGKSSLACSLIGGDPTKDSCLFPVCDGMDSCTKNTSYCGNSTWIGEESNPLFTVVDTPGFQDSDDEMAMLIEEMTKVLNQEVETADVVLLTIDAQTVRFTSGLIDMLKQLEMLFGRVMWNSTMVEISKFSYKQSEIDKREADCLDPDLGCRDEAFFYDEINKKIEENFHIGKNLSLVFIDSFARRNSSMDDEVQQEHFQAETDKLWNFALNSSEFKFKTIDQVLEENAIMREELICLDGIINNDLKNLTEQLDQEINERKMNDDTIVGILEEETNERTIKDDALSAEIAGNVTVLNENISEVQDAVDHFQTSPLGSIIAWVTKPEKAANNETLTIPDGWVPCDGKPIPEPSKWAGSHTPDLNGGKKFLRGGDYTTQLVMEEDMMQDHMHEENQHSHHTTASATSEVTIHDHYYSYADSVHDDANGEHFRQIKEDLTYGIYTYKPSVTIDVTNPSATCGTQGVASEYRVGDETRPVNMNVQWIMKVW